jgi:thymidylate kinase
MLTIAIEGLEGAGKSTFANQLSKKIEGNIVTDPDKEINITVKSISTCSKTKYGQTVREHLGSNGGFESGKLTEREQALLVLTDRLINDRLNVAPHIASGSPFIYDRYLDSTLFLQGYLPNGENGLSSILQLARDISPSLVTMADLTISLEPSVEVLKERLGPRILSERDQFTYDDIEHYHNKYSQYSASRNIGFEFKTINYNKAHYMVIKNENNHKELIDKLGVWIGFMCSNAACGVVTKQYVYKDFADFIGMLSNSYGG